MSNFYTILTTIGKQKIAAATANNTQINLTTLKLGDGAGSYYNPAESQTALKNIVFSAPINNLYIDPNNSSWIVAETIVPQDVGGFYVREVGLFDSDEALLAIGKYPETYKPTLEAGSAKDLYVRMIIEVFNTAVVTLKIDPAIVMASRSYADGIVKNHVHSGVGSMPSKIDLDAHAKCISENVSEFAETKDTLESGSPVLPVSAAEELRQLRGQIKNIQGTTNWYDSTPSSLSSARTHALASNKHLFIQSNTSQSAMTADNGISSIADGSIIIFIPVVNVGASATLDIGFGSKSIKVISSSTGQLTAISANKLPAAKMYPLKWSSSDNCFICTAYSEEWIFTSPGVSDWYAPFSGMYEVLVVGAGGGGGGIRKDISAAGGAGGAGAGGGHSLRRLRLATTTSVVVTVGAGGAAGTGQTQAYGQPGGSSSFGSFCSATGGTGGQSRFAQVANNWEPGWAATSPGEGSGGDLNGFGGIGKDSIYFSSPVGYGILADPPCGGSSIISFNSPPSAATGGAAGKPGVAGSGGSGACMYINGITGIYNGGRGGDGVVKITYLGGN